MGLENLKSIFTEGIGGNASNYQSKQPESMDDSKYVGDKYPNQFFPILDTLLRKAPAFVSEDLTQKFYEGQQFDPRTPKQRTVIINKNPYQGTTYISTNPTDFSTAGEGFTFYSPFGVPFVNHSSDWPNSIFANWEEMGLGSYSRPIEKDTLARGQVFNAAFPATEDTNQGLLQSFAGTTRTPTKSGDSYLFRTQTFDPRTAKNTGIQITNTGLTHDLATNFGTWTGAGNVEVGASIDYTPLTSTLGQTIYNSEGNENNQSWQNLYNANHSYKGDTWRGISPINYGTNVNRDKLNIRKESSTKTVGEAIMALSRNTLGSTQTEPYIISDIPQENSISGGRLINMGNRSIPIARALVDTLRLTKFLASPAGIWFIAKQNIYSSIRTNVIRVDKNGKASKTWSKDDVLARIPQRFNSTYNPLSTMGVTAARVFGTTPNVLIAKSEPKSPLIHLFEKSSYLETLPYKINDTFAENTISEPKLSLGSFMSSLGATTSQIINKNFPGDKMTMLKFGVKDGDKYKQTMEEAHPDDNTNIESENWGMPLYFQDMRDNAWIFFRAYVEGVTENISPTWTPHTYVGRSEPAYIYERGERDITFTLKLVAQTRGELSMIYKKMNRLTSLCYPEYMQDNNLDNFSRMKPPLTKFRMGELYGKSKSELMGFIKSLTYSVDGGSTWETEQGARIPRHITATLSFQVIHSKVPQLDTEFYGYVGE